MLRGIPGEKYKIRNERPEENVEIEIGKADENKIIRDSNVISYSSACYSIIGFYEDE